MKSARAIDRLIGTRRAAWLAVLGAVAIAGWMTWPAWQPGLLLGRDGPRHALRARAMAEMLATQHRVDGWSPYWLLGVPLFLFQSYGYYLLQAGAAMVAAALSPATLSQAQAWVDKLAAVAPVLLLPPVLYRLSRRLGLGRFGAVVAAYASLGLGTETGYGVVSTFAVGLELHAVGVLLVAWTLPSLIDPSKLDRRGMCRAALLAGVTLIVHFISGIHLLLAIAFFALWSAVETQRPQPLLKAAVVAALALLLAGHTLFPAFELRAMMGPAVTWNWHKHVTEILTGVHFGPRILFLAVLAGWLALLAGGMPRRWSRWPRNPREPHREPSSITLERTPPRAGHDADPAVRLEGTFELRMQVRLRRIAWLALVVLLVAILPPIGHGAPDLMRLIAGTVQPRGLAFVCLLLPVFAGVAAEYAAAAVGVRPRWWKQIAALAVAVCVLVSWAGALPPARRWVRTEAHRPTTERSRTCDGVLAYLAENGRPGEIVAYEPRALTVHECGTTSLASLINLKTGLYTLGGDQAELARTTRAVFASSRIARATPEQVRAWIHRYRIAYVLVRSPEVRSKLDASNAVRRVLEAGPVTLFAALRPHPALQGPDLTVERERMKTAAAAWKVENQSRMDRRATISITYHPAWQARLDGRPAVVGRTTDSLIQVTIPPGPHLLALRFGRRPVERLYQAASLAALAVLLTGAL